MSGSVSIYLDQQGERSETARRYGLMLLISVVLHLLLLLIVSLSLAAELAPPVAEEEIRVPLSLEEPLPEPEPKPEPAVDPPAEPLPQPKPEEAKTQPQEDRPLMGWNATTREKVEDRPRPPGAAADIHAPAKPNADGDVFGQEVEKDPGPTLADSNEPEEVEAIKELPRPVKEETPEPLSEPDASEPVEEGPLQNEPGDVQQSDSGPVSITPEPDLQRKDAPDESAGAPLQTAPRKLEELPPRLPPRNPRPRRAPDIDTDVFGGTWGNHIRFDSNDYPWEDYSSKVYWAIYRAWLRELWNNRTRFGRDQAMLSLRELDGEVIIHFVIHRGGGTSRVEVLTPSTMPTLDQASKDALLSAVLPPLPEDFQRDSEGVTFSFRLIDFPSAQALERRLRYSKQAGEF